MDGQLREFLDSLGDAFWIKKTKELSHTALGLMAKYGFSGGNKAERATEYALDAISKAFERCMEDSSSRFEAGKGDKTKTVEERFSQYLIWNCLRPLITGDAEKWTSRARWPIVPLDLAADVPTEVPSEFEDAAELKIIEMLELADDELGRFISEACRQLEDNPDRTNINWTELQKTMKISRYECDQLRKKLDALRERMLEAQYTATTTP